LLKGGEVMNKHVVRQMLVPAWIFAISFSGSVFAQEKHPIAISGEGVRSRYVQQLSIDVDDEPGHQVRVYENQRVYPADKQPIVDGERIVEVWGRGFSNYSSGVGPSWGYGVWITEKGSKIFLEYSGTAESQATEAGSKRGTYHGTSRLVGGTGRFSKIRGYLVEVTKFDTDPKAGYVIGDSRGEYWFDK
jgi:hypothetical protein